MNTDRNRWYDTSEFHSAGRFSDRVLRHAGPLARIPPNIVTILGGGFLALPMSLAFLHGRIAWGSVLFAISSLCDWLDGAAARFQERLHLAGRLDLREHRARIFRLGPTEIGKKIDPLVDKIRYFSALLPLGWSALPHTLIWLSIAFAFLLTFGRLYIERYWSLTPGANAWGKFKAHAEILTIAFLVFQTTHEAVAFGALVAFFFATTLGGISFATQAQRALRQRKTRTR